MKIHRDVYSLLEAINEAVRASVTHPKNKVKACWTEERLDNIVKMIQEETIEFFNALNSEGHDRIIAEAGDVMATIGFLLVWLKDYKNKAESGEE